MEGGGYSIVILYVTISSADGDMFKKGSIRGIGPYEFWVSDLTTVCHRKKREKSVGVKGSHRQEPGNLGWEMIYPRRVAVETGRNVIYRYGWLVMVIVNGDDDDDIAGLALCKLVEGFRPTSLRMAM